MRIIAKTRSEGNISNSDGRDHLCIVCDDGEETILFEVSDGEPEDSNLNRDFNDCYKVVELLKQAYEWGYDNQDISWETEEVDDGDF